MDFPYTYSLNTLYCLDLVIFYKKKVPCLMFLTVRYKLLIVIGGVSQISLSMVDSILTQRQFRNIINAFNIPPKPIYSF